MANKTRTYLVKWCWKAEGNRALPQEHLTQATTVQRAISKTVKDINEGKWDKEIPQAVEATLEAEVRASDLLVVEVSPTKW